MGNFAISKYGSEATLIAHLYGTDGVDFVNTVTFEDGDVLVTIDGGTATNISTLPTFNGYDLEVVLSASELTGARIVVHFVDQTATKTWLDDSLVIYTHGDAAAKYNFDLDTVALDDLTAPGTTTGLVRGQDTDSLEDVAAAVVSEDLSTYTTEGTLGEVLTAINTLTDKLEGMVALNGEGTLYQYTEDSLENGPAGSVSGTVDANIVSVTDTAVTDIDDFKADVSNLDVAVSTRSTYDPEVDIIDNGKTYQTVQLEDHAILNGNTQSDGTEFLDDAGETVLRTVAIDTDGNRTFS